MVTRTISVEELSRLVVALIGLFYVAAIYWRAMLDLVSLRVRKINSVREYAAITTLIAFSTWISMQLAILLVDIVALTVPNRPLTPQLVINAVILDTLSIGLALAAWRVNKRRIRLVQMFEEFEL